MKRYFVLLLTLLVVIFPGLNSFPQKSNTNHPQNKDYSKSNVPGWAKKAVWYQIFVERFRNGDQQNDPDVKSLEGSWPHDINSPWKIHPWTSDWYELKPYEKENGKDIWYNIQRRRYGGDLQGVIDKLDYLKELGVNAIYFNPIFESPSLHKYDAAFYHHIDNNFGPDPGGDEKIWESETHSDPSSWQWTSADKLFLKLIKEAHDREIKVIIDGVFNHTGINFWAFRDVVKNQQESQFKDWFTIKNWDDPKTLKNEFEYEGWMGVKELPELKENENGLIPPIAGHIKAVVKKWMDPNGDGNPEDGIDGWRLDVAEKVNLNFWKLFRSWVKEINPDAYIVGEVWWEDWNNGKMFNAAAWLQGDAFDAVMNYRWAKEVIYFLAGNKYKITPSEFDKRIKSLLDDYPAEVNYVLMNLFDSHDTDRLGSRIVNPDYSYDKRVGIRDDSNYLVRKPNEKEINTWKLMTILQMTSLGSPMIYYGSESGMWGGDDPDCRKPMLWKDMNYDDEVFMPDQSKREYPDKNEFNQELFSHYEKLIQIRNSNEALQIGDFKTLLANDQTGVYVFSRSNLKKVEQYEIKDEVIVVINSGFSPALFDLEVEHKEYYKDVLNETIIEVKDGKIKIEAKPRWGMILVRDYYRY
ncbi:MAG: glycoside hydrolase family 13 protein [Ignavibacteriaceae bacterium]|nr:glycoside hydrolase family 13 protein [Ignavibacteriaceae bacterium]